MFDVAARPFVRISSLIAIAAMTIIFSACGVKNYPPNVPFVYQPPKIRIIGDYSRDLKKDLILQLENQVHDSISPRRKRILFFFRQLNKPPVFDTANLGRSIVFMHAQLNSIGYYRDSIAPHYEIDTVEGKDQIRVTTRFDVYPGKLITLDSVWHNLFDSVARTPALDTLVKLTEATWNDRLLKKGAPFSKPLVSAELDRLTNVYRNNGYLRFSKEQLLAVWDTVGINLLTPTLDFEEQLRLLEELRRRRENPVADIEIRLKPNPDTNRLRKYYVGNVTIYPDYNIDTSNYNPTKTTITRNGVNYNFISYANTFRPAKLVRFIHLRHGELYRQSNYLKTQNKFNTLGAWRSVTINQFARYGQDTVDFELRLVPAKKLDAGVKLDVSRNQGNLGQEGSLLGTGVTFSLVNRNFLKGANQSTFNFRYGIELSSKIDSIQTLQYTAGYTVQFPRMVPRKLSLFQEPLFKHPGWRENARTYLSLNLGRTDRLGYFKVLSSSAYIGWESNSQQQSFLLRWPNIEYVSLDSLKGLKDLIARNKSYRYIFNDGMIVSAIANWIGVFAKTGKKTTVWRASAEIAGMPGLLIKSVYSDAKLYHFLKLDCEVTQTKYIGRLRRNSIAWRIFGGAGKSLRISTGGNEDSINFHLPFFRSYYAGGPNSMRAWSIRKLGPGSTINSFANDVAPDRFGDFRLEGNFEYRFFMAKIVSFPMEGALFTDIGNVWYLRAEPDFPNGHFDGHLWRDLGVGVGYGIRMDFGFLRIRADFAYKAKDPSPDINNAAAQNKLFYNWDTNSFKDFMNNFTDLAQFQLGINYPF